MTKVYRCDRCGEITENEKEVGYGGNAHMGTADMFIHLCNECDRAFMEWIENE